MTAVGQITVGAPSCARTRRALSLVLDSEDEAADLRRLAAHLSRCGSCRRFASDVSAFTRELRLAPVAQRSPTPTTHERGKS